MEQSGIPMDYTADGYCESWGEFSQLEVAGGPDGYVTSRFLFDPTVLAHEIGHNLGLAHDPQKRGAWMVLPPSFPADRDS